MKLLAALAAPLLVTAQEENVVAAATVLDENAFCNSDTITDVIECKRVLQLEENSSAVDFCKNDSANEDNCLMQILDNYDEAQELAENDEEFPMAYADAQDAMNDFVQDIQNDPMLQNVLAELNAIEAFLSSLFRSNGTIDADSDAAREAQQTQEGLKRFVELKQLVAWLQPKDKRISRYCFYGCWCLPEGAHSFVAGEGRPVDMVDKACQNLWFCYTCAKKEMRGRFNGYDKECIPDQRKYRFKFKYQPGAKQDYKQRDISCRDRWYWPMNNKNKWKSNCARAICECDRGLAKRLYRTWRHWDKSRHRIWSQKVTNCKQLMECAKEKDPMDRARCVQRGCLFIVKRRCLQCEDGPSCGKTYIKHELICCGRYPDDGGRVEMRDHGGTHMCCNKDEGTGYGNRYGFDGKWYNTITHCCPNGKVLAAADGLC